jgi:hypothetical protein
MGSRWVRISAAMAARLAARQSPGQYNPVGMKVPWNASGILSIVTCSACDAMR